MNSTPIIIGIESSCDDTSFAVLKGNEVLSNIIANQEIHKKYGGVVPEMASREHLKNIIPALDIALKQANVQWDDIDAIAYTQGPGLLGSLLVGGSLAKSIALATKKPLIAVNHLHAHILTPFIKNAGHRPIEFPYMCLTASGGHTQLVLVHHDQNIECLGGTLDDAAGEAFDKIGKLLGLDYPAGPIIDALAKNGDPKRFVFPIAKTQEGQFSFSGLKTAVMNFIKKESIQQPNFINDNINDLCASAQHAIVSHLTQPINPLLAKHRIQRLAVVGGVSANSYLKQSLERSTVDLSIELFFNKPVYCTDNAAMIAMAGYFKFIRQDFYTLDQASIPNLSL